MRGCVTWGGCCWPPSCARSTATGRCVRAGTSTRRRLPTTSRWACCGATKVEYATFFGGNVEFIHGVQMLPFMLMTELLLPAGWITEEYPVLATALTRPEPALIEGWKGFIVMAHAIIDPATAWQEAQALIGYDDGNTRTNTLYWIATRP